MARSKPARGDHLTIQMGDDGPRVVRVEAEYRFAFSLKNAARVMVNQARSTEREGSHQYHANVVGAIVLSYAYLEAGFYEFLHLHALVDDTVKDEQRLVLATISAEDLAPGLKNDTLSKCEHTLSRYNLMLRILGKPELVPGEPPYQAAEVVRKLRNLLVHPRPGRVITFDKESTKELSDQQKIVRQLKSYLGLKKNATFPADVLTYDCAEWSVGACEAFFAEFAVRSGIDPGFVTT